MKKGLKKGLLLVVAVMALSVCFVFGVSALDVTGQCGDNVYWNYNSETGELVISGEGDMWEWSWWESSPFKSSFALSVVIEDGVKSIGDYAFYECKALSNVTVGKDVTSIGECAFNSCYGLKNIVLPDGVTSIERSTFESCSSLKNLTIPNKVVSIGDAAFAHCLELDNVLIPDSVTSIGHHAFESCISFTNITVPDGVTAIGTGTFAYCENLANVELPESLITIGEGAFYSCAKLSNITIPNSVTSIGYGAFESCSSLESVTIPAGVMNIDSSFVSCGGLTGIFVDEKNGYYSSDEYGVLFDKNKTVLILYPACGENTSYVIPDTVVKIADNSFSGSRIVKEIIIPNSVMEIGYGAFWGCGNLEEIIIPDSVTKIGEYAFYSCNSLKSIKFSENMTEINNGTFSHCDSLAEVVIPSGIEKIGSHAFSWCSSLSDVSIDSKLIGLYAFEYCENLKNVTIGENVEKMEEYAFSQSNNIENVYISNIEAWCSIDFENDYSNPINSNTKLYVNGVYVVNLEIPETVKSIGDFAFCYLKNIKTVALPKSIETIGEHAFYGCVLTDVYYSGSRVSWSSIDFVESPGWTFDEIHFAEDDEDFEAIDSDTGIKAEYRYDDFEGYEGGQKFVATKGGKNANIVFKDLYGKYVSFDIHFEINGYEIQPDYDVEIAIPLPSGFYAEFTTVYYLDEDGNETKLESRYEDGYIVFKTDHFSEYVLVDESSAIGGSEDPSDPTEPGEPDEPSDDCSCGCHKTGFMGFIWKILRFFYKLFKTNQYCVCGVAHY